MRSTRLPYPLGDTVLVLGAGATRGTGIARQPHWPLPPLDADFFTHLQRVKSRKHQHNISMLLRFCFNEFGPAWDLTMERFFNYIWYTQMFLPALRVRTGQSASAKSGSQTYTVKVKVPIDKVFRYCLLAVLEESLFGSHSQDCRRSTCPIHDQIADHLDASDTVISFNYDCLMDASLANCCPHWDPEHSYGFKLAHSSRLSYWQARVPPAKPPDGKSIKLLKLHGSINWQYRGGGVHLLQRPYTIQNGYRDFLIIPPVLAKESSLDKYSHFRRIWSIAFNRLCHARTVVVCGYSLPHADALAHSLFASRGSGGQQPKALQHLIIVNKDRTTRHHLIRVFRRSISTQTRVLVFEDMREFADQMF